ncbi:MAG: prevent-host-death protein [Lentisphaerae bacterium]|nr:prevent-host-death protein [Lentisphaerota bacterium]
MSLVSVSEIKRRGMSSVDKALEDGPVHLVRSNRAEYVVMREMDYQELMTDLASARLAASEHDLKAGRVQRGNAAELMDELTRGE